MNSRQIQELVDADIIDRITAGRIEQYFTTKKTSTGRLSTILGILGALLVSLGVILVIAHNWDDLNKLTKTFFAFLPLLIGQVLCVYTVIRKYDSVAWREISAVILFFAIASCISLISQVYHISGSLSDFLLTWLALGIPVMLIMHSSVTSLLSIAVATWYSCLARYFSGDANVYYFLLIMLLLVLRHIAFARKFPNSSFISWHNWFFMISAIICFGTLLDHDDSLTSKWWSTCYITLFSAAFLLGTSSYFRYKKWYNNPYYILGIAGALFILMMTSFQFIWEHSRFDEPHFPYTSIFILLTSLLAVVSCISLFIRVNANEVRFNPIPFSFLILFILSVTNPGKEAGSLIINLFVLFVAIWYIRKGSMFNHLGILNFGLVIIALLAVTRFFDDEISFVWRGVFFLITGAGFFFANYSLLKKRKNLVQL